MKLAVIGYGFRMNDLCSRYFKKNRLGVAIELAAVVDPRADELAEKIHADWPSAALYKDLDALLAAAPPVDGFMIGTRCDQIGRAACRERV